MRKRDEQRNVVKKTDCGSWKNNVMGKKEEQNNVETGRTV